jgi:hypothetical protein
MIFSSPGLAYGYGVELEGVERFLRDVVFTDAVLQAQIEPEAT